MIELLLILLKEDGSVLRNIFKIILFLNSVIYVTFSSVLIEMLFTMSMCCFINFYEDGTSNYPVLMVFRLFFKLKIAVGFLCAINIFKNNVFTSLA